MSHSITSSDLRSIHDFAISLARQAGAIIKSASDSRLRSGGEGEGSAFEDKKNRVDLVTETDQAVERFVLEKIGEKYPDHKFIGEESYASGSRPSFTDDPTWIVDPIDGTTNFIHGFDFVCISIGFTLNRVPTIGVIYNPFQDKLYSALKGHGAFLHRGTASELKNQPPPRRLPLSHPSPPPILNGLKDGLVAVEWGSDRTKDVSPSSHSSVLLHSFVRVMDKKSLSFVRLAGDPDDIPKGVMAHSLRSVGSAAINYSYVAEGTLDCYWEIGCFSWDVCAGILIAREAGGSVYGRGGKRWEEDDLMGRHFFVVRGMGEGEEGEKAKDKIAQEWFATVEEWEA
ncbi:inositol monophosphatase [Atractiella rhizophila]|nr:inositol monophosphatase [Atractiella rhizophila]